MDGWMHAGMDGWMYTWMDVPILLPAKGIPTIPPRVDPREITLRRPSSWKPFMDTIHVRVCVSEFTWSIQCNENLNWRVTGHVV